MLVSGGKLLAISKVVTDGTSVSGNGVDKPLGIHKDFVVDVSAYNVVAGTPNVSVGVETDPANKMTTFKVSAIGGGGGGGIIYNGSTYIEVDNVNSAISLKNDIVASASSGWMAMKAINESADKWGKTYTNGDNIFISEENVISGRDWSPELAGKLDTSIYSTWSANVEASAAALSAAIDNLPAAKDYDSVSATVYNNSAYWNSTYTDVSSNSAYWNDAYTYVNGFSGAFNTWSAAVENSAADMSAYIKQNEPYWINSSFNVESKTPATISVESAYDADTKTITYSVSAKAGEGTDYVAGDWIDSTKLEGGTIAVSGYKTLMTKSPLYFSADEADPNKMWILHDDSGEGQTSTKVCAITNGWYGTGSQNYTSDETALKVTVPEKPSAPTTDGKYGVYTFHFGRPMAIQININAKFVAKEGVDDMIGTVGFAGVSYAGALVTNNLTYRMLGALKDQYYAASTITRVDANAFGGSWPEGGIDLSFNFMGDADFLSEIQNPCISIHEIIGEV